MSFKKYIYTVLLLFTLPAFAETLSTQGVGGTMDAHGRSPILTVYTEEGNGTVTISADAYVKHSKYIKYPIRYQFFVNKELVSTQFSSPELPGTAKVVVDEKMATIPFNYSVIADLIYPNRTFSSVIQAAVEKNYVKPNYSCDLTISDGEGESVTYSTELAKTNPSTVSSFGLSFEASDDEETKVIFEGNFNFSEDVISGVAQYIEGAESQQIELKGKAISENDTLQSFNVATADDSVTLDCE